MKKVIVAMRNRILTLVLQLTVFLALGGTLLGQSPSTTRKSSKSGPKRDLKSMGQQFYPERSGFVPEPPKMQPMGDPNFGPKAAEGVSDQLSDYPSPRTVEEILRDASNTPVDEVLQHLTAARYTTVYAPRGMLVDVALERDQRWTDAFLTHLGRLRDPGSMRYYYNEFLLSRRARIRDWFLTQVGERASGAREGDVMKELRARLDGFSRDIWDAEENQIDIIDDWNDLQSELADIDVVSIGTAPDTIKQAFKANSQAIEESLPRRSVFLDIVKYRKLDDNSDWHYSAFVITEMEGETKSRWNNVRVSRFNLGKCSPIDEAISTWLDAIKRGESDRTAGEQVSRKVWLPIRAALPSNLTSVYVCADGKAGEIPFAALPITKTELLIDKCATATVPFPGYLVYSKVPVSNRFWDEYEPHSTDVLIVRPSDNLLHANKECNQIAQVARDLQLRTKYLKDRDATSSRVLETIPETGIVHFAAHGLVASGALKRQRRQGLLPNGADTNPLDALLFSSLILDASNSPKLSDRVLSAEQLSRLDCRNLKLVTFAACDSGKGDNLLNGGVLSLVTGAHLGGSDNVVAAHWKVGDDESCEIMTNFYNKLMTGGNSLHALRYAQQLVRDKGAKTKDWAGYFHSGAGVSAFLMNPHVLEQLNK